VAVRAATGATRDAPIRKAFIVEIAEETLIIGGGCSLGIPRVVREVLVKKNASAKPAKGHMPIIRVPP